MDTLCQQIENDRAAKGEKSKECEYFQKKSCKQKKNLCFMFVYVCMRVCACTHAHVKEEIRVAF